LLELCLYEEAYLVSKPAFKVSCESVGRAGICLFNCGRLEESEALLLEYLRRDKDLSDYRERKMTIGVHNHLRKCYIHFNNEAARKHHLRQIMEHFDQLSLTPDAVDTPLLAETIVLAKI
jgi:hypothetical protein